MRPDYTPEFINSVSINETPLQLRDPSKWDGDFEASQPVEMSLNFKLKPCHCQLCLNNHQKIGIRKSIKWHSVQKSKYKKIVKRLKDKGITPNLTEDNTLQSQLAVAIDMYNYHGAYCQYLRDLRKHVCKA